MKFATIEHEGVPRFGLVEGERIHLAPARETLRAALAGDLATLADKLRRDGTPAPLPGATYLPVIPDPEQIFCIGLNYKAHRDESRDSATRVWPKFPVVFMRFASSLSGHEAPAIRPWNTEFMDYEGELAVIIGKGGRHIPAGRAMEHVAGYACFNDISMRDWQMRGEQWGPGKNFPASGPFGPVMATPDEVGDFAKAHLRTLVNGEPRQDTTLDLMIFDIPALIEYCSGFAELKPGDVIVSGTPGGVGIAAKIDKTSLKAGDVMAVEIDGIGRLENEVMDEPR